jgi:hypothetical protein
MELVIINIPRAFVAFFAAQCRKKFARNLARKLLSFSTRNT